MPGPSLAASPAGPTAPGPVGAAPPAGPRVRSFLRRHPVLLLLLLTPGIPEYLSGSSAIAALLLNPGLFLFQLVANLGLYGPGALLIRETVVRRGKSWPSLLAFGCAYAILEEGIALSTLFNPQAGVVGVLGYYGHFAGVSWVWTIGLLMVHTVYSISLPIVLVTLALPETRGRPLLSLRQVRLVSVVLVVDVSVLFLFVLLGLHFWMGAPILVGSLGAIALLVWIGLRLGPGVIPPATAAPARSPSTFFVLGVVLFPGTLLLEGFLGTLAVPAAITFFAVGLFYVVWGGLVLPSIGRRRNERALVALASGLLAPIMAFGVLSQLYLPLVLLLDVAMILFLRALWRGYPEERVEPAAVPAGARGVA
ncbi:MAG TPA: hypothetical protein VFG07_05850 [Thermoplasmata archaeon]|nr:hypothetical protein [Thermoplasmata archaeon]